MYAKYFKRIFDFILSLLALIVLSPLLLILTVMGLVFLHQNPFFVQPRPGKDEKIIKLIKFKSMTNKHDENGVLLPDEDRLTAYGKILRSSSFDELTSLINIIKGDMAVVGPRPQLVRDMLFMTAEQRKRHTVRPGLTGLAQCSGRNDMTWEKKFEYDLEYIENITLWGDIKIIFKTVFTVLKRDGITEDGMETAMDLGDYLLKNKKVDEERYEKIMAKSKKL